MNNDTASPPSTYNPFSIDNIIAYMERTDADKWATEVVRTGDQNCFFGHLFNFAGGTLWDLFESMYATTYMIYPVNDGEVAAYPQATAKERVIAYLKDLRDGKTQTTQDIFDEYDRERAREFKVRQAEVLAVACGQKQQHVISIEKDGTDGQQ
jgi:hypothetical protein